MVGSRFDKQRAKDSVDVERPVYLLLDGKYNYYVRCVHVMYFSGDIHTGAWYDCLHNKNGLSLHHVLLRNTSQVTNVAECIKQFSWNINPVEETRHTQDNPWNSMQLGNRHTHGNIGPTSIQWKRVGCDVIEQVNPPTFVVELVKYQTTSPEMT